MKSFGKIVMRSMSLPLLLTLAAPAVAQPGPDGGYMPGMGMGPGTMGGGWAAGPGGDCPGGAGMMGPGMGMMGGMGGGMMGPGMGGMGMMGMGPGAGMGMHPFAMLDLTSDQRTKLGKIQDETRKRHWDLMGKLFDEQARLRDVYATERPDPKQVGQVYGNIAKLQQQMAEIATDAHNRMFDVLTKEQRDQLQQMRRGMMGPGSTGMRGGAAPGRQMMR